MKNKAFDHSKYTNWIDPNEVTPFAKNSKIHTEKQIKNIVNSIKRFGWQQDVVITSDGILVIGHGRRLAALQIGCEMPYHIIDKTADELTDEDIRELRIADNQTNAETGLDFGILGEEIVDLGFEGFDFDFGIGGEDENNPYTAEIKIPQYSVQGELPSLGDLYDTDKADELIDEINNSSLSEPEKKFLIEAAKRHNCFNYQKIAEYYAGASPEMQDLMERSALVIIDYEDAIANGYVTLSNRLKRMREENA